MDRPILYVVTGPNAAGKSSFIRSRLNDFSAFEVIMTDVYKSRVIDVLHTALRNRKNIILETVFNDSAFVKVIEAAKAAGYETNLIVLFLNTPQQSLNRVAARFLEQNGLEISKGNVEINFNENFKNISFYHYYFDRVDFIYTGDKDNNEKVMTLKALEVEFYLSNTHHYIQMFAKFAFSKDRLSQEAFSIINRNVNFPNANF